MFFQSNEEIILENPFTSSASVTKPAALVSLHLTVRWREWSYYYYKTGVWGGKQGEAVTRAKDVSHA